MAILMGVLVYILTSSVRLWANKPDCRICDTVFHLEVTFVTIDYTVNELKHIIMIMMQSKSRTLQNRLAEIDLFLSLAMEACIL